MGGQAAPSSWKGGLEEVAYNVGPGFREVSPYAADSVKIEVNNKEEHTEIIDVVGKIIGKTEPTRYIIVGAHRDAWHRGAMDNGVGSAILLELMYAFKQLMIDIPDWHPGMTIIFASWSGEEFGKIGSTEFLEQFGQEMMTRAVAYVNIDAPVRGNHTLYVAASPLMKQAIYEASQSIQCPSAIHDASSRKDKSSTHSMYDQWRDSDSDPTKQPRVNYLDFTSDTMGFFLEGGITSISASYRYPDL